MLPFVDMSEKHDREYFSDGLSGGAPSTGSPRPTDLR